MTYTSKWVCAGKSDATQITVSHDPTVYEDSVSRLTLLEGMRREALLAGASDAYHSSDFDVAVDRLLHAKQRSKAERAHVKRVRRLKLSNKGMGARS